MIHVGHRSAGRGELSESRILPDGIEAAFPIEYERVKLAVRSTIHVDGEFELRIHRVIAPAQLQ